MPRKNPKPGRSPSDMKTAQVPGVRPTWPSSLEGPILDVERASACYVFSDFLFVRGRSPLSECSASPRSFQHAPRDLLAPNSPFMPRPNVAVFETCFRPGASTRVESAAEPEQSGDSLPKAARREGNARQTHRTPKAGVASTIHPWSLDRDSACSLRGTIRRSAWELPAGVLLRDSIRDAVFMATPHHPKRVKARSAVVHASRVNASLRAGLTDGSGGGSLLKPVRPRAERRDEGLSLGTRCDIARNRLKPDLRRKPPVPSCNADKFKTPTGATLPVT